MQKLDHLKLALKDADYKAYISGNTVTNLYKGDHVPPEVIPEYTQNKKINPEIIPERRFSESFIAGVNQAGENIRRKTKEKEKEIV